MSKIERDATVTLPLSVWRDIRDALQERLLAGPGVTYRGTDLRDVHHTLAEKIVEAWRSQ